MNKVNLREMLVTRLNNCTYARVLSQAETP